MRGLLVCSAHFLLAFKSLKDDTSGGYSLPCVFSLITLHANAMVAVFLSSTLFLRNLAIFLSVLSG
jgi:hypothetical protein